LRPSGSRARLISVYSIWRFDSSDFALEQNGQFSVVYIVTGFIASQRIARGGAVTGADPVLEGETRCLAR